MKKTSFDGLTYYTVNVSNHLTLGEKIGLGVMGLFGIYATCMATSIILAFYQVALK